MNTLLKWQWHVCYEWMPICSLLKNAASSLELLGRGVIPYLIPEKKNETWQSSSSKDLRWNCFPKYCLSLMDTTVVCTSSSHQKWSKEIVCQCRNPLKTPGQFYFISRSHSLFCFRKTNQMQTHGIHSITCFCLFGTILRI